MKKAILSFVVSATCALGLTGCGGLIKVQRAVEAKGYEVEKVGMHSDGSGRTLTVYTEQELDAAQKQEVAETAKEAYPKDAQVEVVKGDGSGVKTSSGKSKADQPKPNSSGSSSNGARTNH
jgi:hypothetical protein